MRSLAVVFPFLISLIASAGGGCSTPAVEERLCTPNNNVFCRCTDLREGTKRCSADGMSFGECNCGDAPPDSGTPIDSGSDAIVTVDASPDSTADAKDAKMEGPDKCPGTDLAVDGTKTTTITGTTATASADYAGATGACAVATSKDHVYRVIPTGSGALTVTMKGKGAMDPTLYAREECEGKQIDCSETTGAAGTESINFNVLTGKSYYVFADSKAGTEGEYSLDFSLKTGSFCGDNTVDKDEGCDDGNKIAGDGCGNACVPEGDPTGAGACPGLVAHVWSGKTLNISGSTQPYTNSVNSTKCTFGSGAEDRVYAVTPHSSGELTIDLDPQFDGGIQVRTTCGTASTEVACVNAASGVAKEKLKMTVVANTVYYVFVDGSASGQKGSFKLSLSLP